MFVRKHHCRGCGRIFCNDCTPESTMLPAFPLSAMAEPLCVALDRAHSLGYKDYPSRVCPDCRLQLKTGLSQNAVAKAPPLNAPPNSERPESERDSERTEDNSECSGHLPIVNEAGDNEEDAEATSYKEEPGVGLRLFVSYLDWPTSAPLFTSWADKDPTPTFIEDARVSMSSCSSNDNRLLVFSRSAGQYVPYDSRRLSDSARLSNSFRLSGRSELDDSEHKDLAASPGVLTRVDEGDSPHSVWTPETRSRTSSRLVPPQDLPAPGEAMGATKAAPSSSAAGEVMEATKDEAVVKAETGIPSPRCGFPALDRCLAPCLAPNMTK
eukprot:CAMPEP_0174730376 /NCGR_PEP_ID=MMETSP1094-20130205/55463_1 /TAXON_ID=156173 /ORGANISM="Chrysochromulina brevifilum, Strain UTEX LB 985" /LENGTH=324 /DNA_ID=CAMNT_0015932631 /DNA_START=128 /DNA_END=1102 /DNA_ORIENTATION=+